MRKSIDIESLFGSITKEILAKGWKDRVSNCIAWLTTAANSENRLKFSTQLKEELEFAKANIDLLSEEDYKWLLEQEKSPTVEPKKSKKSLSIDSPEFKEALANAPFVCKTHDNEDLRDSPDTDPPYTVSEEYSKIMGEFNKLASSFTAASNTVKDAISKPKLTISSTESQKRLWIVQITKGKKVWYETSSSFTDGYVSSSINDAALYYEKADAEYFSKFVKPSNKDLYKLPFPVKVTVKEVLCTESSSRTVELVKPVVEAIEKPITKTQVRARKPKVKEEWVLYTSGLTTPFQYYHLPSPGLWDTTTKLGNAKKFSSYSAASKVRHKLIQDGFPGFEVGESKDFEDCK